MKTVLKYLPAFAITMVIFSLLGFYPTDCDSKTSGSLCAVAAGNVVSDSCTWKGIILHGKIKFVESFPDIKIKFVNSFPDLKIKFVESFPDDCGEWQIVESFPDIKVKVVKAFPDLKVQVVESFPGKQ